MKKNDQFEKLINDAYSDIDLQGRLGNQIRNVRLTMLKYDDFKKLTARSQFDFCCTICVIATQTSRQDLSKVKLSGIDPNEVFEYSINRKL